MHLTYVIKKNGEREDFQPEKINQWGEWACSDTTANWSLLITHAIKKMYEGATTSELQRALIDSAVDLIDEDVDYDRVAAKLQLADTRKRAYDNYKPPGLKLFYYHMVEKGLWEDMDYTEEQLDYLDARLDHSRDELFSYAGLKQMCDKYLIQTRDRLYETPQFLYMGMSMAIFRKEPIEDVVKLYNIFSLHKVNVPTPVLVGLRTVDKGLASCCLIKSGDSLQSINAAINVAYTMTANRAGIGMEMGIRSEDDPVRGGAFHHLGKLPYYKLIDKTVKANTQQSRGGSATVQFCIFDPEIESLLRLKSQRVSDERRIDKLDYSMAVNDFFIKRFIDDGNITLFSIYDVPHIYELFFSKDIKNFQLLYEKAEQDISIPRTVVKARDVFSTFFKERIDTGRMYAFRADIVNSRSTFKDAIYSSNLCVAPETLTLTRSGYVQIVELENEQIDIWNGNQWSNVLVKKTGTDQKLLKVITDSGYELECTPYHKWYIFDGYGKKYKEVRTHELTVGDKLCKFNLPIIEGSIVLDKAYVNGFYSGDGCLTPQGQRIYLYHEKRSLFNKFSDGGKWTIQEDLNRQYNHYQDLEDKFFVPIDGYTIQSRLDWLSGFLDADGCIYRNGSNEAITASSIEFEFLKDIQIMLQTLGISSKIKEFAEEGFKLLPANDGTGDVKEYWCQKSYRLLITSSDSFKLLTLGLALNRLNIDIRKPQRDAKWFVKIESIQDNNRVDDTYCFNEPIGGTGMFNGILTGQCQEITEPTLPFSDVSELYQEDGDGEVALCNLAAIACTRVRIGEYEEVAYLLLKMVDNIIDYQSYPYPAIRTTATNRRNVGIGLINIAYGLALNGYSYESQEGRDYVHRETEKFSFYLHKASVRLAKEKGPCPWFDRTTYSDGTLPIDNYPRFLDTVCSEELFLPWESLRKDIVKYGMRNSVLEAQMPSETSSVVIGSTNSNDPIRQLITHKSSSTGTVPFIVPKYKELALEYEPAFKVNNQRYAEIVAIMQKFIGQSISYNEYYDYNEYANGVIPIKEVIKNWIYACKLGIKTFYYLNTDVNNGGATNQGCSSGGCTL